MAQGGTPLPLFFVSIHSKEVSATPPPLLFNRTHIVVLCGASPATAKGSCATRAFEL